MEILVFIFYIFIFSPILFIQGLNTYRIYLGYKLAQESDNWPSVMGTIIHSQLVARRKRGYALVTLYEYEVDGKSYQHNVLAYGDHPLKNLLDKQNFMAQHPAGTPITVYYKPDTPQISALFTGPYSSNQWISIAILNVFVWLIFFLPLSVGVILFWD